MAHRYSRLEKGKWTAGSNKFVRRSPVRIPEGDNSALIEAHRLSLIGRLTNPSIQRTSSVLEFLPQFWNLEGRVEGRDLGRDKFLFRFQTEQDLTTVLRKGPYHFKQWMLILQRWEPIVSPLFPSTITLWVKIAGIPVHQWTDQTVRTIGMELGHLSERVVEQARVRVDINGLQPLEMSLDIRLPTGEVTTVDLEYEKLEKHCFHCFSLSHEKKLCPLLLKEESRTSYKPPGTNQVNTLSRLEENKRQQGDKKRSRSSFEKEPLPTSLKTSRGGRISAAELHELALTHIPTLTGRRALSIDHHRHSSQSRPSPTGARRDYRNRDQTNRDNKDVHSHISQHNSSPRARLLTGSNRSPNYRQPSWQAHSKEHHLTGSQRGKEDTRIVRGDISNPTHTPPQKSRISPTPPPRPPRELMDAPAPQASVRSNESSRERRPARERLSLPLAPEAHGSRQHLLDAPPPQNMDFQFVEQQSPIQNSQTSQIRPPSSVFQRLSLAEQGEGNTAINSPAAAGPSTTTRKKAGRPKKNTTATAKAPTPKLPPNPRAKRRTTKVSAKAATKPTKPSMRTRGTRSPLQGANTRKSNAVRTQVPTRKKLRVDPSPSDQGMTEVQIHSTNSMDLPANARNPAPQGAVGDFRAPPPPLP